MSFTPAVRTLRLAALVAMTGLSACVIDLREDEPANPGSEKALTAFSFRRQDNDVPVDSVASLAGTAIRAFLPPGTAVTALKAAFTASPGAAVTVGGAAQASGVTANDFTHPVTYRVTAPDGSAQDYTVTVITDIAAFDEPVLAFMNTYAVPAVSIAATHDGRLVYLKAYGFQDKDAHVPATTASLFRLASVSKPITAVAVMRLVEQGKLSLSDKVFGAGGLLGTTYGSKPYGPHITEITVDQLLHHTAGGWSNDNTDPMFSNPTLTADELISWTLDNRPLANVPGAAYAYSNFGFCLLGRIIEHVTGQPYEQAVKGLVLQPIGISDMTIGGNTLADRRPGEVRYEGQGDNPYGFNTSRLDAVGGWIASPRALAAFLVAVDGFSTKPDLLSASTTAVMTTPSSANANYAAGWQVNSHHNWWHVGSLPGTSTEIIRGENGWNWVALANSRSGAPAFVDDLDGLLWKALSNLKDEPPYDLFEGATP